MDRSAVALMEWLGYVHEITQSAVLCILVWEWLRRDKR